MAEVQLRFCIPMIMSHGECMYVIIIYVCVYVV